MSHTYVIYWSKIKTKEKRNIVCSNPSEIYHSTNAHPHFPFSWGPGPFLSGSPPAWNGCRSTAKPSNLKGSRRNSVYIFFQIHHSSRMEKNAKTEFPGWNDLEKCNGMQTQIGNGRTARNRRENRREQRFLFRWTSASDWSIGRIDREWGGVPVLHATRARTTVEIPKHIDPYYITTSVSINFQVNTRTYHVKIICTTSALSAQIINKKGFKWKIVCGKAKQYI